MRTAVSHLRRTYRRRDTNDQRLRFYLRTRKIRHVEIVQDLDSDGALQPIGSKYEDGFAILLQRQSGRARLRFTIAHEICHSFFYEHVPELKFVPHEVDPDEERLCDFGAAELLMPAASVRRTAEGLPVCFATLLKLAADYSVSATAMFVRLRSLRLWKCIFSEWHRMTSGTFVLANLYGSKRLPWEWEDQSILNNAWQSHRAAMGHTFVHYECEQGKRYLPAQFEVRRFGNRILSLWGPDISSPVHSYPLFNGQ
jgi:Zn-dependent peptidase ImmA (M78 family)